ncbi:IclR family transcriptional regulator domain-containing protein [Streptomyces sp. CMB-StM0423]|uniref:IclR family transcriptional regulator domain-containing protein n=1 Tax=Streptomyces sp. CMB-StM0423 TaxID=2059884 RepID=UPI00131CAB8B|nr:IclR family transcriptional regulator C-terminal domain-containing protein [Streptomyces sp. CMB-StM0423]
MAEILTLRDAVAELVHDGDTVAMEGFTHLIPFAAAHEVIRRGATDLTLVRMTPDLVYDQLIGAGLVRKLVFSWGGNPGVGSLHRFRDAVENGWPRPLEIAHLPQPEIDARLARARLDPLTPRTVTSADTLRAELTRVRRQGYAIVDQELEEGLRSVAAPVRDRDGTVVAAVDIPVPASRNSVESVRRDLLPPSGGGGENRGGPEGDAHAAVKGAGRWRQPPHEGHHFPRSATPTPPPPPRPARPPRRAAAACAAPARAAATAPQAPPRPSPPTASAAARAQRPAPRPRAHRAAGRRS